MAANKQTRLDALSAQILTDNVCPDLAAQATQLVFGGGNPDAAIVFIGEAPGKAEDLSGEPFVGASGKLLNEMLASIGLNREDCYITNIVKYRPPDNRDPLPAEKTIFLPYLQKQLDIIQPKLIVTLGRHSMNSLLPGLKIGEVHGKIHKYNDWIILPLYHPAAAIYNRNQRQTLFDDFALIPTYLQEI